MDATARVAYVVPDVQTQTDALGTRATTGPIRARNWRQPMDATARVAHVRVKHMRQRRSHLPPRLRPCRHDCASIPTRPRPTRTEMVALSMYRVGAADTTTVILAQTKCAALVVVVLIPTRRHQRLRRHRSHLCQARMVRARADALGTRATTGRLRLRAMNWRQPMGVTAGVVVVPIPPSHLRLRLSPLRSRPCRHNGASIPIRRPRPTRTEMVAFHMYRVGAATTMTAILARTKCAALVVVAHR